MKTSQIKAVLFSLSVMAAAIAPNFANAHESGARALGAGAGATDVYLVSCFDDGDGPTSYLTVAVQDLLPKAGPIVNIQIFRDGFVNNASDLVDGDAVASPFIKLSRGDGTYFVIVNKTKSGAENYQFEYHCMTAGNAHTGTSDVLQYKQNQ